MSSAVSHHHIPPTFWFGRDSSVSTKFPDNVRMIASVVRSSRFRPFRPAFTRGWLLHWWCFSLFLCRLSVWSYLQTRIQDWREGLLESKHLIRKLETADWELERYESEAAPRGWSCHWDRYGLHFGLYLASPYLWTMNCYDLLWTIFFCTLCCQIFTASEDIAHWKSDRTVSMPYIQFTYIGSPSSPLKSQQF